MCTWVYTNDNRDKGCSNTMCTNWTTTQIAAERKIEALNAAKVCVRVRACMRADVLWAYVLGIVCVYACVLCACRGSCWILCVVCALCVRVGCCVMCLCCVVRVAKHFGYV